MKRRKFLKETAAVSTFTILRPDTAFSYKANSAIQLGFIGCGSRGSTVIASMSRNTNVKITALGDLFQDQLDRAKQHVDQLNTDKGLGKVESSAIFKGSQAYQAVLDHQSVDAVLISSPCYTHPDFLAAAVNAGKHVYCEKPAAMDVNGCLKILKLGQETQKVSIAIGFQVPHASAYAEMIQRIRAGGIGQVVNVQLYYMASEIPLKPYQNIPFDEARIRNHFHFRELSGGTLLDQGIHMLDVCNRALGSYPIQAMGLGGLDHGLPFGNAWNHYQVIYTYPHRINVSYHSTQLGPKFGDVCARFIGTEGMAEAHYSGGVFISGKNEWDSGIAKNPSEVSREQQAAGVFLSSLHDADANKHKAFVQSIEEGKYLNEAKEGALSTLTAILGRNAAEAQSSLTWEEMYHSNESIQHGLDLHQFND